MLLLAFVLHSMLVLSEACLTSVSVRLSCKEPWFLIFLHACRHVCRCHFRAASTHAWWVPMPLESWEHTFQELFVDRPRNCTCSSGGRYFLFSQMTYVAYEITQWQFLTLLKLKNFPLCMAFSIAGQTHLALTKQWLDIPHTEANVWCFQVMWLAMYTSSARVVLCTS